MAAIKTSPPVIVLGMTLAGIQLQDWLIMATIIYTVIQIIIALPELKSLFNEWRDKCLPKFFYLYVCCVCVIPVLFVVGYLLKGVIMANPVGRPRTKLNDFT